MLIIPDTNVLYSDPFLEGPLLKTILAAEGPAGIRLVVPEVVIDELRNHVEERLEAAIGDADKVRRDYARLSGLNPYAVDLMITSDQRRAVIDRFDKRVQQLAEEGRILNYPSPSPKELAQRSIKGRAPFKGKDRGMRDTLVWLTAKDRAIQGARTGSKVTLVAKDGAFWDKGNGKLDQSLEGELESAGIPRDSITVLDSLQDVIDTFVSGKLAQVEWVRVAIEGGQVEDFTSASDKVSLELTDLILQNPDILAVGDYIFVDFDIVEEVVLRDIEGVLDLGKDEVLVESNWTCEVAAEGFDNPHFGRYMRGQFQFKLSSIIEVDNASIAVKSHEVNDLELVEMVETRLSDQPYNWRTRW